MPMDGENSLLVLFVVRVVGALARPLSLRLQGRTFGAPHLTAWIELCELARALGSEQSGTVTGDKRPELAGIAPLQGGSFAASFGRGPYVRGGCRARLPRHRPQPVPAVTAPVPHHTSGPRRHARTRCADRRVKLTVTTPERHALSVSAPPPARAPEDPF